MTKTATVIEETPVLCVDNLLVEIPTRYGSLYPVNKVSFSIIPGEILGLVGESGAGKSMTGNAISGLLDRPARIAGGKIELNGRQIDNLPTNEMRRIRGREIGMIFQDPLTSLNPLLQIGEQLVETIREHLPVSRSEALKRAIRGLEEVGIPAATERMNAYPHEFSGGMRQRVVIALALCAEPQLIIADEPTTALDVSVQAQIISLLKRLCFERGASVILVTHDMGVIAETADRVAVMYAGQVVESGAVRDVLSAPRHPYAQGLTGSVLTATRATVRLHQIPGSMPRLDKLPIGCAFHPRCSRSLDKCRSTPIPTLADGNGRVACWNPMEQIQ